MKLIVLDLGNTNLKLGVFEVGRLVHFDRLPTEPDHPEKTAHQVRHFLANALPANLRPNALISSSVVPKLEHAVVEALATLYEIKPDKIVAAIPGEINAPVDLNGYPPNQLGPDRLVNLCAAHHLYPNTATLVIDLGTATTFDLLDTHGRFRGGVIAPGLETFWKLLPEKTGRLPLIDFIRPETVLGMDTKHCLGAGLSCGYVGLYQAIVGQIQREYTETPFNVLMTGGLAKPFLGLAGESVRVDDVDPWLTLKGLYHLYKHHIGGGI